MRLIIIFLILAACSKEIETRIERVPQCNLAQCYLTDGSGIYLQIYRDCTRDFKLVKDSHGKLYYQVTRDTAPPTSIRVDAQLCEWVSES